MSRRKKGNTEKFHYSSSDIHYSSGWCTESYRLADKQRQIERDQRKTENAAALGVFWELIDSQNFVSFWAFMCYIYKQRPELKELFVGNHSLIRDAIYSRANDISCGFTDLDYNQVCNQLKTIKQDNLDLEDLVQELRKELRYKTNVNTKLEERILELETILEQSNKLTEHLVKKNLELYSFMDSEKIL